MYVCYLKMEWLMWHVGEARWFISDLGFFFFF